MKLWLDDIRDPQDFGHDGWHWVRTAEEAIAWLVASVVTQASLDHDLSMYQMTAGGFNGVIVEDGQKSGYDVVCWLEQNPEYWPEDGVEVHSQNPAGRQRMQQVIDRYYHQADKERNSLR